MKCFQDRTSGRVYGSDNFGKNKLEIVNGERCVIPVCEIPAGVVRLDRSDEEAWKLIESSSSGVARADESKINERTVVHCPPDWKGLAKPKAKPRSVKESVSKQLDEEMLLALLYLNKRAGCSIPMAMALADPELTDLLYQRDLILMSGCLTPAGEEAARRILRKYGILNRLASQG